MGEERAAGLERVVLSDGALSATYVPAAGMIGISLADGGDELLGQRRGLGVYLERGKTMGIPLLHPWANRLAGDSYEFAGREVRLGPGTFGLRRDGNGLPMHGLMAAYDGWQLTGRGPSFLCARLDFGADRRLLAGFPFPHLLELEASVSGGALRIEASLTATGDLPVPLAFGFHPYLTLPGAPRSSWRVELPPMRQVELDERGIPAGPGDAQPARSFQLGDTAWDDGFVGLEPGAAFAVSGGGRRIEVAFERGYPAAQVFAPAGEDLICFEPMAAPTNALVSGEGLRSAEPGRTETFAFTVAT